MFVEYEAVLTRPEYLAATGPKAGEISSFLDGLAALVVPVQPHFLWRPQPRDPLDGMVLDAAVNNRADAVATFYTEVAARATTVRLGIEVLQPADVLGKPT